ncbi:MAG: hypothetical protein U0441_15140 [Polyangiaceae bacterium]
MSSARRTLRRALFVSSVAAVCGLFAASCAKDLNATVTNACPSQDVFQQSVSPYMERRCGTLDCHGGIARPMRLFGKLGLRHPDENNIPGGKATTTVELDANYTSVCGIEPEKMNDTVANLGNSADELLMIRKARGLEKHKGGKVVNEADHADNCMLGWLRGDKAATVDQECAAAIADLQ